MTSFHLWQHTSSKKLTQWWRDTLCENQIGSEVMALQLDRLAAPGWQFWWIPRERSKSKKKLSLLTVHWMWIEMGRVSHASQHSLWDARCFELQPVPCAGWADDGGAALRAVDDDDAKVERIKCHSKWHDWIIVVSASIETVSQTAVSGRSLGNSLLRFLLNTYAGIRRNLLETPESCRKAVKAQYCVKCLCGHTSNVC